MFFNKLISIIYGLVDLRGYPMIKDATSYKVIGVEATAEAIDRIVSNSPETLEVEGELCCVCLSGLEAGEDLRVLPCLHKFHKACVERWFDGYCKTCPLCRFSMGEAKSCKREEQLTEEMVVWFSSFHAAGF
ncbi:hypothetical protein Tsubulata_027297 [Turnera subulata]|uniref:RING-type E3 ubiquitin transferase n=1 Tax=Turnera subulata TaxID=218843 RepID=A0A9Q0JJ20_9ROSI|nr:hypothetical protein Tsubulata_027297 [Turnera subulata]